MAYKDYVLVRYNNSNTNTLCQAPPWTNLKTDDEVMVDTGCKGIVVSNITLDESAEILNIILPLSNQERIPKIKSKIEYKKYSYPDDIEINEGNGDEQTM